VTPSRLSLLDRSPRRRMPVVGVIIYGIDATTLSAECQ
jgi:hypothetical protein